jgi:hypothetical protein
MSEYVKDISRPNGWKVISYGAKGKKPGSKSDGAPVTAEGMDEGAEASEAEEGPDSCEE